MSNKRKIIMPTPEEDAKITAAALSDPDARPFTDEEWAKVNPVRGLRRGRGRPVGSGKKEQVTLRIDTPVLDAFKSEGDGWQTRMNEALKGYLALQGAVKASHSGHADLETRRLIEALERWIDTHPDESFSLAA